MNIPEEFGKYLLLKKLAEDPLGETFRAGRAGKDGIEQVVLLRVFNGKGMDGERLWQKVADRGPIQQALRSPNIGSGVDLGKVRSFPYVAYDYISGKNLATLFAQAERQMSPIPTDHALLITERISLALAAAYETRVQDERVMHGFVAPHLVMISNEGEARLLGFEVAPGLRAVTAAGWTDPVLLPYLAPEALDGGPIAKVDDVWSLGAILYEVLTGERLPVAGPEGHGALIDAALLPNEGTPLPPAIVGLLKKSLAPRDQRIADPVTWHKALSKLMIDGQYSPTTFNLAFFMHSLFRDEIERETNEVEAEKKLALTQRVVAPAPAPVPVMAPAADLRESTGVREKTLAGVHVPVEKPSSNKGLVMGLAAAVVLAAVGGGAWFVLGKKAPEQQAVVPAVQPNPMTQAAAMPVQPAAPAGPTREELEAQIKSMMESQSQQMEAKFKTEYEQRLKQLQQQLDSKQREEQQRAAQAKQVPAPVVQAPEPEPVPVERPAVKLPEPEPAPVVTAPVQATPEPEPVQQQPAAPVPAPKPAPRQIQFGDLVQPGTPGVTMPKLTGRLDPRYPAAAQRLNKAAQVDIKVLVDENGRVLEAQRSGPKAGLGFDESALEAARRARFNAGTTREGVRVKMWTTIRVSFQPGR
jgi:TonB family protein